MANALTHTQQSTIRDLLIEQGRPLKIQEEWTPDLDILIDPDSASPIQVTIFTGSRALKIHSEALQIHVEIEGDKFTGRGFMDLLVQTVCHHLPTRTPAENDPETSAPTTKAEDAKVKDTKAKDARGTPAPSSVPARGIVICDPATDVRTKKHSIRRAERNGVLLKGRN